MQQAALAGAGLFLLPEFGWAGAAAQEAVEQAYRDGQVFRLVLLDYHMPNMNGVQFAERLQSLPHWKPCPMILLSSSVSGLDSERLKSVGINRFMPKPVIDSELLPAMLDQFGGVVAAVATPRDEFPAFDPRRILLAEDNPINQKVVLGFLHKWGQQVVVASDGRQAVQAVEREPFDLVLMDVQMPELDGYEATAAIRAWERKNGLHIPIVAMTAEAMKGDRERCLEASMDDYLTKPIDSAALYKLIASYPAHVLTTKATPPAADGKTAASAGNATSRQSLAEDPGGIDWNLMRRYTGNDDALLQELVDIARNQCPKLLADAQRALVTSDAVLLRRTAHTLKSNANYFGAQRLADASLQLELLARREQIAGDAADATASVAALEKELTRFLAALESPPPSSAAS